MSKRTQEGVGEERVTAKSRPMTNLVSRCRAKDPIVLASTASENRVNTKSESQKVPLSLLNVQLTGTGKPVTLASSSNSSEWNNDEKWSAQVRKSGEMSKTSTVKLVSNKLVIDIDVDSDTAAESDLSLKSRSFLNRVNDRLRKMLNRSPEDSMHDIDTRSMIWWMLMSSTLEASVFMGKNYSDNLHSIRNTWENFSLKKMFETSEQLILERSDEISGVSQISWESSPWKQLSLVNDEEVISPACKGLRTLRFCVMSWKDESEPNIKYCLGTTVGMVQRLITTQHTGQNRWRSDGIRVTYFPGFSTLELVREVQKFMSKMGEPEQYQGRIFFMSMFNDIIWWNKDNETECIASSTLVSIRKKISSRTLVIFGPGSETKWYSLTKKDQEENGIESQNWWWSNSEKADTQFSEQRVHCPEERSKAKEVENYLFTSVPMVIRLKLIFAQSFLSISSLSTEQFQNCVKKEYTICQTSTGRLVVAEQPDPFFAPADYW